MNVFCILKDLDFFRDFGELFYWSVLFIFREELFELKKKSEIGKEDKEK